MIERIIEHRKFPQVMNIILVFLTVFIIGSYAVYYTTDDTEAFSVPYNNHVEVTEVSDLDKKSTIQEDPELISKLIIDKLSLKEPKAVKFLDKFFRVIVEIKNDSHLNIKSCDTRAVIKNGDTIVGDLLVFMINLDAGESSMFSGSSNIPYVEYTEIVIKVISCEENKEIN